MSSRRSNLTLLRRALLVAVGSFAFAFALVPLYRVVCEQVLGIKLESTPAGERINGMVVDESRLVTVEFTASVNSRLPWQFRPKVATLQVHPGQLTEVLYVAENTSDEAIIGQAVPSVAPNTSSIYFNKTECFCFTEQLLGPGEARDMPVRFVIDPALPESVKTLTLSYTFYNNEHATARLAAGNAAGGNHDGFGGS